MRPGSRNIVRDGLAVWLEDDPRACRSCRGRPRRARGRLPDDRCLMKKEYSAALEAFHQCCCMYFFLVQRYKMADGEVRRAFRGAPHDRRHARALYEDAERRDATVRGRGLSGRTTGADVTITPEMLWSWSLSMPGPLWRTMQRLGGWIEPVLVAEWVRLTRAYALRMGLDLAPGAVEARMVWSEPSRDTALARIAAGRLVAAGRPIVCVWSRRRTRGRRTRRRPRAALVGMAVQRPVEPDARLAPRESAREARPVADSSRAGEGAGRDRRRVVGGVECGSRAGGALRVRSAGGAADRGRFESGSRLRGVEWRRLRVQQDQAPPLWVGSV